MPLLLHVLLFSQEIKELKLYSPSVRAVASQSRLGRGCFATFKCPQFTARRLGRGEIKAELEGEKEGQEADGQRARGAGLEGGTAN